MTAGGPFFTVAWIAPTTIGFQPQHPQDGTSPFFTTAWHPRLGTTEIRYGADATDAATTASPAARSDSAA